MRGLAGRCPREGAVGAEDRVQGGDQLVHGRPQRGLVRVVAPERQHEPLDGQVAGPVEELVDDAAVGLGRVVDRCPDRRLVDPVEGLQVVAVRAVTAEADDDRAGHGQGRNAHLSNTALVAA